MKRKRYKLYDNYTTYYILVGIALMYALLAALSIWIYKNAMLFQRKLHSCLYWIFRDAFFLFWRISHRYLVDF